MFSKVWNQLANLGLLDLLLVVEVLVQVDHEAEQDGALLGGIWLDDTSDDGAAADGDGHDKSANEGGAGETHRLEKFFNKVASAKWSNTKVATCDSPTFPTRRPSWRSVAATVPSRPGGVLRLCDACRSLAAAWETVRAGNISAVGAGSVRNAPVKTSA